jgi:hypothetical protein
MNKAKICYNILCIEMIENFKFQLKKTRLFSYCGIFKWYDQFSEVCESIKNNPHFDQLSTLQSEGES